MTGNFGSYNNFVAIIDGMSKVQKIEINGEMNCIVSRSILQKNKYKGYGEIHFIFDRYDLDSLKDSTKKNRLRGEEQ